MTAEARSKATRATGAERVDPGRRVAIVLHALGCGGAERAATLVADGLAARGHRVTVMTLDDGSSGFWPLRPDVERVALDLSAPSRSLVGALRENRRRVRVLREALARVAPDVVISFVLETNVLAWLATRPLRTPLIASERTDPRLHAGRRAWRALGRFAYRRSELVVANSASVAGWLEGALGHGRVAWVPNMVAVPEPAAVHASGERPFVLALGRLDAVKGHAELLQAFACCAAAAGYDLVIVGHGPERARLEELARTLGIDARVRFTGALPDPTPLLRSAAFFALSSRYEGFPNALLEAMAHGLAAVATDTGAGACELIEHETSGLLVPPGDRAALAAALERLCADEALRATLGEAARARARSYVPERVVPLWEAAVERVLAAAARRSRG
jgi:glycosyltransferase involved in cell wall biosynthesis